MPAGVAAPPFPCPDSQGQPGPGVPGQENSAPSYVAGIPRDVQSLGCQAMDNVPALPQLTSLGPARLWGTRPGKVFYFFNYCLLEDHPVPREPSWEGPLPQLPSLGSASPWTVILKDLHAFFHSRPTQGWPDPGVPDQKSVPLFHD